MKYFLFTYSLFISILVYGSHKDRFYDDAFYFTKAEILDEYTTRIPFTLVDRLIVIEGMHKDKKGMFIIDTGSEKLLLNNVHFSHLITRNNKIERTAGVLDFVDDPVEKRIQQLLFNGLSINNKRSNIIDMSHIEQSKKIKILGIIGYNVLKDYEVFIDMYLNQITLTKIDKHGKKLGNQGYLEKIVDSIDFNLKNHTIVIEGNINGKNLTFGLDTGAELNQLNTKIPSEVLKSFYPKERIKLLGASNNSIEVIYGLLYRLKLSKTVYFGPMKTILINLHSMNEAFGTKLDGILGHDFFAQKRAIINYKKEKIYSINFPIVR